MFGGLGIEQTSFTPVAFALGPQDERVRQGRNARSDRRWSSNRANETLAALRQRRNQGGEKARRFVSSPLLLLRPALAKLLDNPALVAVPRTRRVWVYRRRQAMEKNSR